MNLAVGFFDGVHLGHRRILSRADAVLTFLEHPSTVFAPARAPRLLMTAADRVAAIRAALRVSAPADAVCALHFTRTLAEETPERFADWLRQAYPALETLFCGANWTFGAGGKGDAAFMRARGFSVEVVPYADWNGEPVSSTRIRSALAAGALADANAMLGRPYALAGKVLSGKGLGRNLGFPTLNVHPFVPDPPLAHGVYAVDTPLGRGLANWGVAPTMRDRAWAKPVLEIHLLKSTDPGPVSELAVSFRSFLRPERAFASAEELSAQIVRDIAVALK